MSMKIMKMAKIKRNNGVNSGVSENEKESVKNEKKKKNGK